MRLWICENQTPFQSHQTTVFKPPFISEKNLAFHRFGLEERGINSEPTEFFHTPQPSSYVQSPQNALIPKLILLAVTSNDSSLKMSSSMTESQCTGSELSRGLREFSAIIDNTTNIEDLARLPRTWQQDPSLDLDTIYDGWLKEREDGMEAGISVQREVIAPFEAITRWIKKPARKIWKTLRAVFKHHEIR